MMTRECPEWCGTSRLPRTRPAYSRHHHDLAHRPFGSTRDKIGVPHPVHGRLDYADSKIFSRETIADLADTNAKPRSPAGRDTNERAFVAASKLIQKTPHPRTAFLEAKGTYLQDNQTLPYLVFNGLDRMLFCSKLIGNVCLRWERLPWGVPGRTYRAGLRYPRITIELSEKLIWNVSKIGILTALLHQMIHAYFLQCCGYRAEDSGIAGYRLGHGLEFQALKNVIAWKLRETLSDRALSRLHSWNPFEITRPSGRIQEPFVHAESKPGCSNCYRGDLPLSRKQKETLRLWMEHAISSYQEYRSLEYSSQSSKGYGHPDILYYTMLTKLTSLSRSDSKRLYAIKLEDPDASAAPSSFNKLKPEDYIELHFEKRIFPLKKEYTNDLQDLSKSPFFTNKRELHFPSTFSWSEFRSLYSFLVYKDFDPRLSTIHSSPLSKDYKPGPPVILTKKDGSQEYLSTSVAAAQLGSTLSFKPLITHAIYRLNNLGWTTNNPVKALAQIYHGSSSPNSDLRGWVKAWLAVKIPTSPDAAYAKSYATNLAVLKNHPNYKNEFALIREKEKDKKKELNTDIEAVEKQLTEAAAKAATEVAVKDAALKEAAEKEKETKEAAANKGCCSSHHAHGEPWDAPYRWQS